MPPQQEHQPPPPATYRHPLDSTESHLGGFLSSGAKEREAKEQWFPEIQD